MPPLVLGFYANDDVFEGMEEPKKPTAKPKTLLAALTNLGLSDFDETLIVNFVK